MQIPNFLNKLPQTIYCERGISDNLLSEPINAFTNALFLILSYFILKKHKRENRAVPAFLYVIMAGIGIGSFLYHTYRNPVTLLLDAIPIYVFILSSLYFILRKLTKSSIKPILILTISVGIQVFLSITVPREFLNGSIRHLFTIFTAGTMGVWLIRKEGEHLLNTLILAISSYALAITFRSIDKEVCSLIPFGSHFLWHVFAALTAMFTIDLVSKTLSTNPTDSQSS